MVGNDDSKTRLDELELPLLIQIFKPSPFFFFFGDPATRTELSPSPGNTPFFSFHHNLTFPLKSPLGKQDRYSLDLIGNFKFN